MNPESGRTTQSNPFLALPVAGVSAPEVTVETQAVLEVRRRIDEYLARGGDRTGRGMIVPIVGEYGTGKTHLAATILEQVGEVTTPLYLNGTAGTFGDLYRLHFVPALEKGPELMSRLKQYYGEIVADALSESGYDRRATAELRQSADPVRIVSRLGLNEQRFLAALRDRLSRVTREPAYATALTLLLRPDFEDSVWSWLSGRPPAPALRDRRVTITIDTERAALEAIGVLTEVFGAGDRPFVVVIDELQHLLSQVRRPDNDAIRGFKQLLQHFTSSGGLLVLSGVSDYYTVLPADVRQRMGPVVRMEPLSVGETVDFIRLTLGRSDGGLLPFDRNVAGALTQYTHGNIRMIAKYCHALFERAGTETLTLTQVDAVVRDDTGGVTLDDVRGLVREVAVANGWEPRQNIDVGGRPGARADIWIPIADSESSAGCSVLVTGPVLDPVEALTQARRAEAIKQVPDQRVLLVVVGTLAAEPEPGDGPLVSPLRFNGPPLIYDPQRFTGELAAELKRQLREVEETWVEGADEIMRERVERIGRQVQYTQRSMARMIDRIESLQTMTQEGFEKLRRTEAGSPAAQPDVPEDLRRPFDEVRDLIDDLGGLTALEARLQATFQPERQRRPLEFQLRTQDIVYAAGMTHILRDLLRHFQDACGQWLFQGDRDQERLADICRSYDRVYAELPLTRIDGLDPLAGQTSDRQRERRARLRSRLATLSGRVREATLTEAGLASPP